MSRGVPARLAALADLAGFDFPVAPAMEKGQDLQLRLSDPIDQDVWSSRNRKLAGPYPHSAPAHHRKRSQLSHTLLDTLDLPGRGARIIDRDVFPSFRKLAECRTRPGYFHF